MNRYMKTLAIFIMIAVLAIPINAATGTLYSSGVTAPMGTVSMGNNIWIADHLLGFCRLDPSPTGGFAINQGTCNIVATAPGQPTFDPNTKFVYIPDLSSKSKGIVRLAFNADTNTVESPAIIAPSIAGNRPTSTALGPDGSLYVGFLKNGNVIKITNPGGTPGVPTTYGQSSDGRGIAGLAFAGSDLYLAEGAAIAKISGGGKAIIVSEIIAQAPTAIMSLGTDTLFIADTPVLDSTILRYTISTGINDIYATMGRNPDLTTIPFKGVSGLGTDPVGNIYIGDDPTEGVQVLQGHAWSIAAGSAPEVPGAGLPPPPPAMKQGVLNATGITSPSGGIWLGDSVNGNLWVSDHLLGFCRLDKLPAPSTLYGINQNTCNNAAVSPGQPYFDVANNYIYIPDNSAQSRGVWRLQYNPGTETITGSTLLAPNAGLGSLRPTTVVLGSDGKLYVGFIKTGDIKRITNPGGIGQTVEPFGKTSDGRGVSGLTFVGNDLYVAEGAAVTKISGGGNAIPTFIDAVAPTAIVSDGVNWIFVADTPVDQTNILRYGLNPAVRDVYVNIGLNPDGTTLPFKFVSGLAVDSMANLYVMDDPTEGAQVLQGHIWTVPGAFDDEYCYNNRGKLVPCRGN